MAILGGGPGGPVGSSNSFVGPQEALELIGNHGYAFNVLTANNATVTAFEFTTGNYYFVGSLSTGRNMKSTAETTCTVEFNDSTVYQSKWDNGASQTLVMPCATPLPLIIPSYTKVKISFAIQDNEDTLGCILAGEIYRG